MLHYIRLRYCNIDNSRELFSHIFVLFGIFWRFGLIVWRKIFKKVLTHLLIRACTVLEQLKSKIRDCDVTVTTDVALEAGRPMSEQTTNVDDTVNKMMCDNIVGYWLVGVDIYIRWVWCQWSCQPQLSLPRSQVCYLSVLLVYAAYWQIRGTGKYRKLPFKVLKITV